jgi:two-component system phosphate regulon sensor histidine kinase PhoR
VRRNLFWKLALTFLALLLSVLVAVDFFAERALRRDSERATFEQLATVARFARAQSPEFPALTSAQPDLERLNRWATEMGASGVRVTVIRADGQVLADSQSDPRTMENHAERPEVQEALAKGEGRSVRHSVTLQRDFLYYAVRQDVAGSPPIVLRFAIPRETSDQALGLFRRSLWVASFVILLVAGMAAMLVSRGF